ncbi:hypothetical protein Hanom_Chr01g00019781 [Helianthus anomalus]
MKPSTKVVRRFVFCSLNFHYHLIKRNITCFYKILGIWFQLSPALVNLCSWFIMHFMAIYLSKCLHDFSYNCTYNSM